MIGICSSGRTWILPLVTQEALEAEEARLAAEEAKHAAE